VSAGQRHSPSLDARVTALRGDLVLIARIALEGDSLQDIVERLHKAGVECYRQKVARRVALMRDDLVSTGERLPPAAARRESGNPTPNAGLIARSWAKHRL